MSEIRISTAFEGYVLKLLSVNDHEQLGDFFQGLSKETRMRYAPHPLDKAYARKLCLEIEFDPADRFVLSTDTEIIGYFILDPQVPVHEADRYKNYAIELESGKDCMFAPCMADAYQDKGLGGKVMPSLLEHCQKKTYKSLVLLGGTQESNRRALQFYRKFGFNEHGGFHTEVYNIDMRLLL